MENRRLNCRWGVFLPILSLAVVFGCAKPDTVVIEQPVGPSPSNAASVGPGWLVVYTDIGYKDKGMYLEPTIMQHQFREPIRLPYTIVNLDGQVLQTVVARDQNPEIVVLGAGNYIVRGHRHQGGAIEVKVHIVGGKTTSVVLDGSRTPNNSFTPGKAVYGPDGSFVGWRAASS